MARRLTRFKTRTHQERINALEERLVWRNPAAYTSTQTTRPITLLESQRSLAAALLRRLGSTIRESRDRLSSGGSVRLREAVGKFLEPLLHQHQRPPGS